MTTSSSYNQFISHVSAISPDLCSSVAFLPKEIHCLNYNEVSGEFTISYLKSFSGKPMADAPPLQGSLIKVEKEVVGTLEPSTKTLSFSKGISLAMGIGPFKMEIALEAVRDKGTGLLELVGSKWGKKMPYTVSRQLLSSTKIDWI